ncbi:hypothetical protein KAR91_10235 [Candidatus Pacearchaeota archaeon]|nr:hypothetical protein [Candidatus Pacearchaeota archaeon]
MKELLFVLVFALAFSVSAVFAAPFLVCDPQAGVISYELEINGTLAAGLSAEPDGSIRYNLVGLADGPYEIRARGRNVWDWSEWSHPADAPLSGTKALPQAPTGLRVSLE